jgi:hypothetical protein
MVAIILSYVKKCLFSSGLSDRFLIAFESRKKGDPPKPSMELATTKSLFLMLFHALFLVLPVDDVRIWMPSCAAQGLDPDSVEAICPIRQHPYVWNKITRMGLWSPSNLYL